MVYLKSTPEPMVSRAITFLRIILYVAAVGFGALLLIVNPTLATFAFFVFCLGGAEPTTFTDLLFDVPWREIPPVIGDWISGQAPFALLLFALTLTIQQPRARLVIAGVLGAAAFALGAVNALDFWRVTYGALPAQTLRNVYQDVETVANMLTGVAFAAAFVRTRGAERHRTAWIIAAFLVAGIGRFLSDHLFPAYLNFWQNGTLLALSIAPVIVVWVAVVKDHFFDVDFVVSRALVYTAITAAVIGIVGGSEELMTYIFYNNTNLAYGLIIVISIGIGSTFGKVTSVLQHFVDRFIFRERRATHLARARRGEHPRRRRITDGVQHAVARRSQHPRPLVQRHHDANVRAASYTLAHSGIGRRTASAPSSPEHPLTRDIAESARDAARGRRRLDDDQVTLPERAPDLRRAAVLRSRGHGAGLLRSQHFRARHRSRGTRDPRARDGERVDRAELDRAGDLSPQVRGAGARGSVTHALIPL